MKSNSFTRSRSPAILLICLFGSLLSLASSPGYINNLDIQSDTNSFLQAWLPVPPHEAATGLERQTGRGKLVLGGTYTLEEGETLEGDLVIAGGRASLKTDSQVQGNILVMGGSLHANGLVTGDILILGGQVVLGENASVSGSVNTLGGSLERVTGSEIQGEQRFTLPSPALPGLPENVLTPRFDLGVRPLWRLFWILMQSFLWAAAAVLVTLFIPEATQKVGQAISFQPAVAGGFGCLVVVVAPVILFLVGITIIGIPISLLAGLVLLIAWSFGIIAAGLEVGLRLGAAFKREWAMPVSAAAGAFLLSFVINSIDVVIPCVGWFFPLLVGMLGLGAVLLTRFGTRSISVFGQAGAHQSGETLLPPEQEETLK